MDRETGGLECISMTTSETISMGKGLGEWGILAKAQIDMVAISEDIGVD